MSNNHVIMFRPEFHDLIREDRKTQTIRPPRKRLISPGDNLSIRGWSDKPYRSPQFVICNREVLSVSSVIIYPDLVKTEIAGSKINGPRITTFSKEALDIFAEADGFANWQQMLTWFNNTHAEITRENPFKGVLIKWKGGAS